MNDRMKMTLYVTCEQSPWSEWHLELGPLQHSRTWPTSQVHRNYSSGLQGHHQACNPSPCIDIWCLGRQNEAKGMHTTELN